MSSGCQAVYSGTWPRAERMDVCSSRSTGNGCVGGNKLRLGLGGRHTKGQRWITGY